LHLKKFYKHSKILNEQTAMISSNEDWVTLTNNQSTLTYFSKGELRLLHHFEDTVSLNLLSSENVMIKNDRTRTMQCFSVQDKKFALT